MIAICKNRCLSNLKGCYYTKSHFRPSNIYAEIPRYIVASKIISVSGELRNIVTIISRRNYVTTLQKISPKIFFRLKV